MEKTIKISTLIKYFILTLVFFLAIHFSFGYGSIYVLKNPENNLTLKVDKLSKERPYLVTEIWEPCKTTTTDKDIRIILDSSKGERVFFCLQNIESYGGEL